MFNLRMTALGLAIVVALGGGFLSACAKKGPVQKAGEKLDKAKEKVEDTVNPKGPAQKAGRKIDKAVE